MKTIQQNVFLKTGIQYVDSVIHQILGENYGISQIFFIKMSSQQYAQLVIVVEEQKDAEDLLRKKWIEKAVNEHQVKVCIFDSVQIRQQFSLGNPFIEVYCRPAFVIYQNNEAGKPFVHTRSRKKFREVFEDYKDMVYHDYHLLQSTIEGFDKEDSSISTLLTYENIFKYCLNHLEELYTGNRSISENLHERIKKLQRYLPELERSFVRRNKKEYFLIHFIEQAKKSLKDGDFFHQTEMLEAFRIAQDELYHLVEMRLHQFNKMLKSACLKERKNFVIPKENNNDTVVDTAVEIISKSVDCEEIYFFHKTINGDTIKYYVLIIGFNIGNIQLASITQSLESTIDKCCFVLLSHSRPWIQEKLPLHQSFFVNIIQGKNKVYESHAFHPEPHWEYPHTPIYSDLDYHYEATRKTALQYLAIADNSTANYQGLAYFFTLFVLSFCRTYIYAQLYYMPHYLSHSSLWSLCEYANPEIQRYRFLFQEFRNPFFSFLDYHMSLHHDVTRLNQEVKHMTIIVERLQHELQHVVVDGRKIE